MSETFLIRRTERGMIKEVYWSPCKVPFFSCQSLKKLNFLDRFSKNIYISNFMKIRLLGAECSRRTDLKLIVAFRSFANAPKTCQLHEIWE